MVTYGEWEQGADFERTASLRNGQGSIHSSAVPGGSVTQGVDAADIASAATAAAQAQATPANDGGITSGTSMQLSVGQGVANTQGGYYATTGLVYPRLDLPNPLYPVGAVGIEWESSACTPVAAIWGFTRASAQWVLSTGVSASSTSARLTVSVSDIQLAQAGYGAPYEITAATFAVGPGGLSGPASVDLTEHLRPDGQFLAAMRIDPLQFLSVDSTNGRGASVSATVTYLDLTYTLRPPRHRWLYGAPPSPPPGLPPLRQSPRDDNLGTASAARIWPSSSQQNSLRRLGYF